MKKLKNVPVTNRGQWDYPGMDTIVPSGNITMQGVPYPVMGVDNTGHSMMMMPGGEYTFPGDMVYEKPMMQSGGGWLDKFQTGGTKYIPAPDNRVYNDNTQLFSVRHTASTPTPKANITSLIKDKEYQLPDRSPKTEAPAAVKQVLGSLDKATDYMQMAHFIPDPTGTSQVVGTLGDVIGVPVDLAQSAVNVYEGDYGDAVGNLALAGLTGYTGMKGNGYTRPVSLKTGKGASGNFLNKKLDSYRPLTPANTTLANNPVIQRGLKYNKATLAGNVGELANSVGLPDIPATNAQTQREYQDNLKTVPLLEKPEMQGGGEMIRRADGSYSQRGLWDNIRANKGSDKKPTKEMLDQERKIRREEKAFGGVTGWLNKYK